MNQRKFTIYVKLLSKLYEEDDVAIFWRHQNGGLNVKIELEDILKEIDEELSEEEFLDTAFEVMSISRYIAAGSLQIDEIEQEKSDEVQKSKLSLKDKVDIIKEYFLNEDLIQYINVQTQSIADVLDDIDYEILTKRSKNNPTEIITHSLLLNLITRNNFQKFKEEEVKRINVELTEKDVDNLIEVLNEALSSLNKIKIDSVEKELTY